MTRPDPLDTERFTRMREQAEAVRGLLAENVVTVRDSRGAVTLSVGSGGVMQSLRLDAAATRLSPDELAAAIMRTYRQGCRDAAHASRQILSQLVGPESPTLRMMAEAVPPAGDDDPEEGAR